MEGFVADLWGHGPMLLRMALAAALGGLIGLEREWSGKPAGFRTHLLIALGAALFTELSLAIPRIASSGQPVIADPTRIAAQIVSGIGFLGAGAILHTRGSVVGLTTAATMWVVAGIGMAVGGRAYFEAGAATLVVLVALLLLVRFERLVERRAPVGALIHVRFTGELQRMTELRDVVAECGVRVEKVEMERREGSEFALHMRGSARPASWGTWCRRCWPGRACCGWTWGERRPYTCRPELPPSSPADSMVEIFKAAIQRGASDIHIKAGDFIRARIDGALQPLTRERLNPEQVKQICLQLIQDPADRDNIDGINDYDCSWGAAGVGRFRVNILRQRGTLMAVLRVIPIEIPDFEALKLPPVLARVAAAERGMILVTGVTGSGKSSTLAAMIGHINGTSNKHILTLENPIEFLHRDRSSSVTQRDVGSDTPSFEQGLKSALREDPDVILIGEMRDTVTIDTGMKAAETGHLVLSTLHTTNAVQTISRMVAVFPPHEQEMVRIRLSEVLVAVISQRLLPRKDGKGRVAAVEVMIATPTIRDAILDRDRVAEIHDFIADGREQYGSQTFDQHLMDLVREDVVDFRVAQAAANNPSDFELRMNTLA